MKKRGLVLFTFFVFVIIILATLFSIYIAFNVVVSDRKKEIGILNFTNGTELFFGGLSSGK